MIPSRSTSKDRREHLTAMNHPRQADCEIEIACRGDGTILGVRGEVFIDLGAYVDQWVDPVAHFGAMLDRPLLRTECADHLDGAPHQ